MRVMLVDDSSTMRRIEKTQIAAMGISEIIEAENGEEALSMLQDNMPIDVIFLDWNMPVMNGITFLRKMRENPKYASVKVIMCTSESEKSRVVEALQAGAHNFIVKPFTPEVLRERLEKVGK
ncbi:MAG: response regulator [Chitinivibrionales bacterium]|nr:response regulator [Chitinivibrionales bacterium]MBD3359032.1 response regulator [Chitinivibrionales bacterium]